MPTSAMDAQQQQEEWKLRSKLFKDWLENGGIETITEVELLDDLMKVRLDDDGLMIPSTTSSSVRAMSLAILNANLHPPAFSGKDQTTYSSLFNKSLFIDPVQIDSEEAFDKLWEDHFGKTDHLFRGQREAIWQLYTSGQRAWITDRLHETEESYEAFLLRLVHNARTLHDGLLPQYFERVGMDGRSDVAVLSFLQHFGAPTPLQDWTWSFANAVFFALDGLTRTGGKEADSYCSVYFVPESGFASAGLKDVFEAAWKDSAPKLSARSRREFIDAGFITEEDFDRLINMDQANVGAKRRFAVLFSTGFVTIERLMGQAYHWPMTYFSDRDDFPELSYSLNNSLNIQNQKGVFMFNTHEALPVEHVGFRWREKDHGTTSGYRFCGCWNINKDLEPYIRAKLDAEGVTKNFIYPDPATMNLGMDPWAFAKEVYQRTKTEGKKASSEPTTKE